MFPFVIKTIFGLPIFIWIEALVFIVYALMLNFALRKQGVSLYACIGIDLWIILWSAIGGKAYELLDNWPYYQNHFDRIMSFTGHGFLGILTLNMIAIPLLFFLWKGVVAPYLDTVYYYLPVGISLGRINCLITADGDYGLPTDLPWGMAFPYGYIPTAAEVHPTPLYEIIVMMALFFVLKKCVKDKAPDGAVFVIFLWVYSIQRFFIEFIRLNKRYECGLTLPQLLCLVYMIIALVVSFYLQRKQRET